MIPRPVCTACPLHVTCAGPINAEGPDDPKLVLCSEAPGEEEDFVGLPFQGKSGKVLDAALEMAGISRSSVYITNCVRCRPEKNREPHRDEIKACRGVFLQKDLDRYRHVPWVLLGGIAISYVGDAPGGVRENNNRHWTNKAGIQCWGAWHPAAVLRGMGRTDQVADVLARAIKHTRPVDLRLAQRVVCSFDSETDGLDRFRGHRAFMATSTNGKSGRVYDLTSPLDRLKLQHELRGSDEIVFQNRPFDVGMFESAGLKLDYSRTHDTRILAALADSGDGPYGLEKLGDKYFGRGAQEKHDLRDLMKREGIKPTDGFKTLHEKFGDQLEKYALEDAVLTWALYQHPVLHATLKQYPSAYAREQKLFVTLKHIEDRGMLVALDQLPAAQKALSSACDKLLSEIRSDPVIAKVCPEFNPRSSVQVGEVCKALDIESTEHTKTGNLSYGGAVLEASMHPIGLKIAEYRSLAAIRAGAMNNFPSVVDRLGVVHPSYDSVGSETGRFTGKTRAGKDNKGERINLVGLPKIPEVRGLIRARPGYKLVSYDYRQVEQRGLAHFSQDPNLVAAYNENPDADFYCLAGKIVYGVEIEDPSPERQRMKRVILAKGYGAGIRKLAKILKLSLADTEAFVHRVDQMMPGVPGFFRRVEEELRANPVFLAEDWPSRLDWRVAYQGVNRRVQGGCAVHLKRVLNELDERFYGTDRAWIVHHNHDEILFEIPERALKEVLPEIANVMVSGWNWSVPIRIECKVGDSWGTGEVWQGVMA